ncbi:MAG: GGDEF domain-containing protein [Arenimonas sp.]
MTAIEIPHPAPGALEHASRPLLALAQQISSLESTFLTSIDWDAQTQKILFALNTGELQVAEGSTLRWRDSLCRNMLLSGRSCSSTIGTEVAATSASAVLGVKTFVSVPILRGDVVIGTVCAASRQSVVLTERQAEGMQLIADALQQLLEVQREGTQARLRAVTAEKEVEATRLEVHRHAAESLRMRRLAHTDVLTGLPNRRGFIARWEDELARSGRRQHSIGLLIIDANRFKLINDNLGHAMGDAVLRGIGATLLVVAKPGDLIGRLGGDEFAFSTTRTNHLELAQVADRIQALFGQVATELGIETSLSIGIACSDECPRERLLTEADQAMYRNKSAAIAASEEHACSTNS